MIGNTIAWIDLTEKRIEFRSPKDYEGDMYLGGRGLGTRIYWEEMQKGNNLPQDSVLIFMTGPAVGTGIKGATRLVVIGKSALSDGFSYGNIGGFFPSVLRKAGFIGLAVKGSSETPCYIYLCGEQVELCEAGNLWGKNAFETMKELKKKYGPGIEIITIGRAGEKLVRFSTIVGAHMSSATGGFGAIMGAKKLKAIVVKKVKAKNHGLDKNRIEKVNEYISRIAKRVRLSIPPKIVATQKQSVVKVIGKGSCYGCDIECIRGRYEYENGLRAYRKCQSMEYYLPWMYGKDRQYADTLARAPELANDYGLCTLELEHIVDWLYACYKQGTLGEKETGLPLSDIGSWYFLTELLEKISEKNDLGEILAEGLYFAKDKITKETKQVFDNLMKPISAHILIPARDLDEARGHLVNALLYQFEPRRYRPILHQGFTLVAWQLHLTDPSLSPVSYDVYRRSCEKFWGSELAADDSTYEGKALAAVKIQNKIYAIESLGLCTFAYPITYSLNTEDHLGDPDIEAKILEALTGTPVEEGRQLLEECGSKTATLQRKILLREGWNPPECDYPPDFHFIDPLPPNPIGQKVIVPGKGGKPFVPTGTTLDFENYKRMLKEYYSLRGWDTKGIPPDFD